MPFAAADCDLLVTKVSVPFLSPDVEGPLCLEDYFELRKLASYSIGQSKLGTPTLFYDTENIQFDDMFLFKPNSTDRLGNEGRLSLVKSIYRALLSSLQNEFGTCSLHLYSATKELTIEDFLYYHREEAGQPGSRLMLTYEDVTGSRWELLCSDDQGKEVVEKAGTYFFIFVDVYENIGTIPTLQDHLSKYLISLR